MTRDQRHFRTGRAIITLTVTSATKQFIVDKVKLKKMPKYYHEQSGSEEFIREWYIWTLLYPEMVLKIEKNSLTFPRLITLAEFLKHNNFSQGNRHDYVYLINIFQLILEEVHHAHSNGVVHRDIKPDNILLQFTNVSYTDYPIPKVILGDWGSASVNIYTKADMIYTTFPYAAPESLLLGNYSPKADIWACGCILYEMFKKSLMFPRVEMNEVIDCISQRTGTSVIGLRNIIEIDQESIIATSINKDLYLKTLIRAMMQVSPIRRKSALQVIKLIETLDIKKTTYLNRIYLNVPTTFTYFRQRNLSTINNFEKLINVNESQLERESYSVKRKRTKQASYYYNGLKFLNDIYQILSSDKEEYQRQHSVSLYINLIQRDIDFVIANYKKPLFFAIVLITYKLTADYRGLLKFKSFDDKEIIEYEEKIITFLHSL